MSRGVLVVTIGCLLIVGSVAAGGESKAISPLGVLWEDRTVFEPGLVASERAILDRLPGATVYHIGMTVGVDAKPTRLRGTEAVLYTNRENVELDEIYFHLYPNAAGGSLDVISLFVDDAPVDPIYEFDRHVLRVSLSAPLSPGESTEIRMTFEEEVPTSYEGWGPFGYTDEILSLDQFYPSVAVYDDEGWNIGHAPLHGDWSYCDTSFYLVRLTAPSHWIIAATGVQIGCERSEGRQTVTFAAGPVRDFYLAASPHFVPFQQTYNDVLITHYVLAEGFGQAPAGMTFSKNALEIFAESFGEYPYTELDFVTTSMTDSAMEYPGIIAMAREMYDPAATVWGTDSSIALETTIAHETAHQWFYNIVGNDQIDEPWLDEALAQYCTFLYYEEIYGTGDGYRRSWDDRMASIHGIEFPIGLASEAYERRAYSAVIYGRGPQFLYELRRAWGKEEFHDFLRKYFLVHRWGIATTESFRCIAEIHCQCNLTDLFEQWVYPTE